MQRGSLTDFSSILKNSHCGKNNRAGKRLIQSQEVKKSRKKSRHYAWSLSAHCDPAWMPSSMTQRMAEQLKRQPYAQPTWAGSRASWTCCYEPISVVELLAMLVIGFQTCMKTPVWNAHQRNQKGAKLSIYTKWTCWGQGAQTPRWPREARQNARMKQGQPID